MLDSKLNLMEVIEHLHDGLYLTDKQRRITFWNRAATRITGYEAEEVLGRSCADNVLVHVDEQGRLLCNDRCPLSDSMETGAPHQSRIYLRHKLGHRIPISVRANALRDHDGSVVGGAELFSDASAQRATEEELRVLRSLALLDTLTQIPNRRQIESELEACVDLFERSQRSFGVLFVDVDHFKDFNDLHGHGVGDQALQTVARTLKGSIRAYDVAGRWGGEEFIVIAKGVGLPQLERLAHRVCVMLRQSCVRAPHADLQITASVGATTIRPGEGAVELVERADQLMYESKAQGRDRATVRA